MKLLKVFKDIAISPIKAVGQIGEDLSSLNDIRKDETDGILSIFTLGASSVVKSAVKTLKDINDDLK